MIREVRRRASTTKDIWSISERGETPEQPLGVEVWGGERGVWEGCWEELLDGMQWSVS